MSKNNIRLLRKALRLYLEKHNTPKETLIIKKLNEEYTIISLDIHHAWFRISSSTIRNLTELLNSIDIIYKYNASKYEFIINNKDIDILISMTKIL